MNRLRRRLETADADSGVAMITVLLVGMLLTAIAIGSLSIATNNLKNAGRDRVGGGALGAAEAGLAEAVNYLRGASLTCFGPTAACGSTNPWRYKATAPTAGKTVSFSDGSQAVVSVQEVVKFSPPLNPVGRYRIRAVGTSGNGPGLRSVEQEISVKPLAFPLSVYANSIEAGGTPSVFQQSVLSKNDICGASKLVFTDSIDPAYGIPAAAHSTGVIYTDNNCNQARNRIHDAGKVCPDEAQYRKHQDSLGGPLPAGSPCLGAGGSYPQTTYFGPGDFAQFGGTDISALLPMLRSQAIAQGTFFTSTTGWTPPSPAVTQHAVLYFQVGKDAELKIQNELDAYTYNCASPRSVIIVVDNASNGSGGVTLNSNADLAGALFMPKGSLQFNGNATFTGPIFADKITRWNGTADSQLTTCYLDNLPPGLLDIRTESYREVDSIA